MSLTSYRAAPPRAIVQTFYAKQKRRRELGLGGGIFNIVNGSAFKGACRNIVPAVPAPPAKPGDDLLFHCLSSSTIGAVRFHGRVRDGIGWVTDAMATKLW